MQQIERYGVIALVFLLVTIVAISFWGDSKSPGFWSRLTGKSQPKEVAKIDPTVLPQQIADPNIPLSPAAPTDVVAPTVSLGGPQPTTTIDAPGLGGSTLQPDPLATLGGPQQPVVPGPIVPVTSVPAPSIAVVAPPAGANEYVVQRGDSLARIARNRLGAESRWQEIATLNPKVDPKSLTVGQKLVLPSGTAAPVVAKTNAPRTAEPKAAAKPVTKPIAKSAAPAAASKKAEKTAVASRACIVQKGDTLRSIARRELGDERLWKEIASANPGLDPAKLAIGMRVKLPQKGGELLAAAGPSTSPSTRPTVR
ncbi:MAG: LysM domain-containing protein [Planctomycetota bacterium]|nr:LysM domain-containing protein [Planctomycetota bacterium]